jgi:hypothetical protein
MNYYKNQFRGVVKVVKVVWGIWQLNLFCRLKIKIQNKLISLQTPFLPSLPSQVHYLLYFGYKNINFTNFFLIITNFLLTSSELGDLVKNCIKKKIYIRKNICNGGELGNFVKIEKFTDMQKSRGSYGI